MTLLVACPLRALDADRLYVDVSRRTRSMSETGIECSLCTLPTTAGHPSRSVTSLRTAVWGCIP
eukprot:scaffold2804_cov371-Prasinococcus_capsulatus_cf.AAC.4